MFFQFLFDFWDAYKDRRERKRIDESSKPRTDATYDSAFRLIESQSAELAASHKRVSELETRLDDTNRDMNARIDAAELLFDAKYNRIESDFIRCIQERSESVQIIAALREQLADAMRQLQAVKKAVHRQSAEIEHTKAVAEEAKVKVDDAAAVVEKMKDSGASGTSIH